MCVHYMEKDKLIEEIIYFLRDCRVIKNITSKYTDTLGCKIICDTCRPDIHHLQIIYCGTVTKDLKSFYTRYTIVVLVFPDIDHINASIEVSDTNINHLMYNNILVCHEYGITSSNANRIYRCVVIQQTTSGEDIRNMRRNFLAEQNLPHITTYKLTMTFDETNYDHIPDTYDVYTHSNSDILDLLGVEYIFYKYFVSSIFLLSSSNISYCIYEPGLLSVIRV